MHTFLNLSILIAAMEPVLSPTYIVLFSSCIAIDSGPLILFSNNISACVNSWFGFKAPVSFGGFGSLKLKLI